jgi:hypothetical protein
MYELWEKDSNYFLISSSRGKKLPYGAILRARFPAKTYEDAVIKKHELLGWPLPQISPLVRL